MTDTLHNFVIKNKFIKLLVDVYYCGEVVILFLSGTPPIKKDYLTKKVNYINRKRILGVGKSWGGINSGEEIFLLFFLEEHQKCGSMKSEWHGLIFFFSLMFGTALLIASTIEESIEIIILGLLFLVIAFLASKKGWKR